MEHINRTEASVLPVRALSLPYYLLVTLLRAFARVFKARLDIMVYVGDIWDNKPLNPRYPALLLPRGSDFSVEQWPLEPGPSASLYRGHRQVSIALKVWRMPACTTRDRDIFYKRLEEALMTWKGLDHPNIANVFGTMEGFGRLPAVVMPFYEPGNVNRYIKNNHSADILFLISGVVSALRFLHGLEPAVTHGDVRGNNIFVNQAGEAVLSDIGISNIPQPPDWTISCGDSVRWMAPEAMSPESGFNPEEPSTFVSPRSDVYSFGMTILELYSGKVPFSNHRCYAPVVFEVMRGSRPFRPQCRALTDDLWEVVEACWKQDPLGRPDIDTVGAWLDVLAQKDSLKLIVTA